jgi:hypothetical protein
MVFILEIIHQTPIVGTGLRLGEFADDITHNRRFARADRTGDKDVVTGTFHVETEIDGLQCPFLADGFFEPGQLCSRFEVKEIEIAFPTELCCFETEVVHTFLLCSSLPVKKGINLISGYQLLLDSQLFDRGGWCNRGLGSAIEGWLSHGKVKSNNYR